MPLESFTKRFYIVASTLVRSDTELIPPPSARLSNDVATNFCPMCAASPTSSDDTPGTEDRSGATRRYAPPGVYTQRRQREEFGDEDKGRKTGVGDRGRERVGIVFSCGVRAAFLQEYIRATQTRRTLERRIASSRGKNRITTKRRPRAYIREILKIYDACEVLNGKNKARPL